MPFRTPPPAVEAKQKHIRTCIDHSAHRMTNPQADFSIEPAWVDRERRQVGRHDRLSWELPKVDAVDGRSDLLCKTTVFWEARGPCRTRFDRASGEVAVAAPRTRVHPRGIREDVRIASRPAVPSVGPDVPPCLIGLRVRSDGRTCPSRRSERRGDGADPRAIEGTPPAGSAGVAAAGSAGVAAAGPARRRRRHHDPAAAAASPLASRGVTGPDVRSVSRHGPPIVHVVWSRL